MDGGDFHFARDRGRTGVESATKDERKAQDIVDLVRIVGTPSGNDRIVADSTNLLGHDLGRRIG